MSLDTIMSDKQPLWEKMKARHGLADTLYGDVSSWRFADFVFGWDYDFFGDGTKARRFGFQNFVDTEEMFQRTFAEMRQRRIIP